MLRGCTESFEEPSMGELNGKIAFVTGGIGLAMAEPFGRRGAPPSVTAGV
jgi:hypothetical protein